MVEHHSIDLPERISFIDTQERTVRFRPKAGVG